MDNLCNQYFPPLPVWLFRLLLHTVFTVALDHQKDNLYLKIQWSWLFLQTTLKRKPFFWRGFGFDSSVSLLISLLFLLCILFLFACVEYGLNVDDWKFGFLPGIYLKQVLSLLPRIPIYRSCLTSPPTVWHTPILFPLSTGKWGSSFKPLCI